MVWLFIVKGVSAFAATLLRTSFHQSPVTYVVQHRQLGYTTVQLRCICMCACTLVYIVHKRYGGYSCVNNLVSTAAVR